MKEPWERARLFIVTSNRLVRESLARVLGKRPEFVLGGSAPFSPEALGLIVSSRARILVFDPPSKSFAELDFIRQARRASSGLQVLLVGMTEDENTFLAAVQAGVMGYMLEDASAADLAAAAQALLRDEAVCSPRLCHVLFKHLAECGPRPLGFVGEPRLGLTRRQRQLVDLIAQGLTNKEIAAQLHLSEQTVKNHIHNMLEKVQADDRLALVRLAGRLGPPS